MTKRGRVHRLVVGILSVLMLLQGMSMATGVNGVAWRLKSNNRH